MSLMISGITVPQTAPAGTLVGYLHVYNSGVTVPSSTVRSGPSGTTSPRRSPSSANDGKAAALVRFLTEPQRLFEAIEAARERRQWSFCWRLETAAADRVRTATENIVETAIWDKLVRPITVRQLKDDGAGAIRIPI